MNFLKKTIICILFCLLFFGCKDPDIETFRGRIKYSGFSAILPSGKGWYIRKSEQTPILATFRKETDSETYTIYGRVYVAGLRYEAKSIEDFKTQIEEALEEAANDTNSRFKLTEEIKEINLPLSDRCLGHEIRGVDVEAVNAPDNRPLSMVIYRVSCPDTKNPKQFFIIDYSERGFPEEICTELPEDAIEFFREIRVDTFSLLAKEK